MISVQTQEQVVQCFAPKAILENVSSLTKADGIIAFRVASSVSFQINNTGPVSTLSEGTVLGFHPGIQSINFTTPVTLEVM